jgi:hypothetical protein
MHLHYQWPFSGLGTEVAKSTTHGRIYTTVIGVLQCAVDHALTQHGTGNMSMQPGEGAGGVTLLAELLYMTLAKCCVFQRLRPNHTTAIWRQPAANRVQRDS